jgi:protein O-mannosyl-transferase
MRRRTAAAIAFLAGLLLFLPALGNGFAYDDVAIIQGDPRVHALANVPGMFTRGYWADAELALYRPLTTASFALDWSVSGGRPAWFMLVNALWHGAVSALALLLIARFTSVLAALAGALIFAAHPVHVEAVANAVGRAELMAAAFMLTAILSWPRVDERAAIVRHGSVHVLFALALLTKESAIMLPALLVLVDVGRGDLAPHAPGTWLRARAVPLFGLALVSLMYLVVRAAVLGGIAPARLDAALEVTQGVGRFMTALQAWPVYLRLLVLPTTLLADYGPRILMPAPAVSAAGLTGAVILLALLGGGLLAWWRGRGSAALALLWLPIAILPVSNLIIPIGIIVAERTLYLPSLAVCIGVAMLVDVITRQPRLLRATAAAGFAVVLGLLAIRSLTRIPEWRSTDTIFAALLRDRPDAFRAHWHHARLAAVANEPQRALELYVHALELWPHRTRLVLETVRAAARAGEHQYARDLAAFAASRWPDNESAARLHAAATIDAGDTIAARHAIRDALRRFPDDSLLLRMQHALSDGME